METGCKRPGYLGKNHAMLPVGSAFENQISAASKSAIGGPGWQLHQVGGHCSLVITGDWVAQSEAIPGFPCDKLASTIAGQPLGFDTSGLGRWDTGLIAFLWDAERAATAAGIVLDPSGLPESARKLLGLLPDRLPTPTPAPRRTFQPLALVGAWTIGILAELGILSALLADVVRGGALALVGRTGMRGVDLMANMRDAGPAALLIVGVVNVLIGAILAFVGAVQLRKFAADAYVANLVGLAVVREMAAVMTAIVMAGRTGGAYAARIATMQGNEEIDALQVTGIPINSYILLPAVTALVVTLPLLYLYGCLAGMLGGFAVSTAMLNVTGGGYLQQTINAVSFGQFGFGFGKSIAFAVLIGVTSCRIGLRAGRSSADVGAAATQAVVVGIVGVIALDALFAVIANTAGV